MTSRPHAASIAHRLGTLPGHPELRGQNVHLRAPRKADARGLFVLFSDPVVMRYWTRPPMTAHEEAEGQVDEMLQAFAHRDRVGWVVADRTDAAIGTCTLFHFDSRHRHAEVGYALRSGLWGKGLAREAVGLALAWGFETLGLHRVEACIDPRNDPSRRLLERLGFASEGVMRERYFVGDRVTDSEVFGLLEDDWRRRRSG